MNDENRISIICAALLFAVFSAFIVLKSARDALFLSDFSPKLLPYLMAITTSVGIILSVLYLRVLKFVSLINAVRFSFLFFFTGTIAIWLAITIGWSAGTLVLYLWTGLFGTLATVQAWSLITERMLSRQARRSFQIVGSGSVVGGLVGGLFARWTTGAMSVAALLPLASLLILGAFFFANALSVRLPAPKIEANTKSPTSHKRFVVTLIIFVAMTTIVSSFADFQIKVYAQRAIKNAAGLAAFFGTFYAYSGAATFLFQIVCVGPMMRKLPLSTTLAMLPGALFLGNGFLFFTHTLTAAVVLKASESTLDHTVDRASMELLYMAFPEREKVRVKSLIDTIGVRVTELVAAGIMIVVISIYGLPVSTLAFIAMLLTAGAVLMTFRLGKEYRQLLQSSVKRDEVRFSEVRSNVFTSEFYNLLPDVVNKASKETVLDLLDILATNKKLTPHLEVLLKHTEADVRLKALQLLFPRSEDLSHQVVSLLSDSDRRVRLEAMHYLYSKNSTPATNAITGLRNDPDPAIQAALAAAPLNGTDEQEHTVAYDSLSRMLREYSAEGRAEVAGILGYVPLSDTSEKLLRTVLSDSSLDVQRAALKSIARVAPPGLAADLMNALDHSPLVTEIRSSLASYGESLIPQLQKMVTDARKSHDQKKLVIKIARTIGGTQARDMLLPLVKGADLTLRFAALKALNRLKKDGIEIPAGAAEELLSQEVGSLNVEMQRREFVAPEPGGLMDRVLAERESWAQERIFRALGLIYNSAAIENAYVALHGTDRAQADKAVEWLDSSLRPEHRSNVLSFVDRRTKPVARKMPAARKSILLGYIGGRDQLPAATLIAELQDSELNEWLNEIRGALKIFTGLTLVEETLNFKLFYSVARASLPAGTETRATDDSMNDAKSSKYLTAIQKIETLSRTDIFSGLGPQELLLLANQTTEVEFQPGDMIVKEGENAEEIFVIIRGEMERLRQGRVLEPILQNETFGVLAALTQTKHFFSVRALTGSLCLRMHRNNFVDIIEDYPVITYGIFRVVAGKMELALDRVQQLEEEKQKRANN